MLLQDVFHSKSAVVTVSPEDSIAATVALMKEHNVGAVVVVRNEKVAGILTDRDVVFATLLEGSTAQTPVANVMQEDVRTIWADQGIFNACQSFAGYKVRRLPVVDRDNKPVGLVSADDLLAVLARELFNVSRALEPALTVKV